MEFQFPYSPLEVATPSFVQFGILSPGEIRQMSVLEVDNCSTTLNGKPVRGGLSDPRLGPIDRSNRCETCANNLSECPGHFGHIELAKPVFHFGFMKTVLSVMRCVCFNCSRILLAENDDKLKQLLRIKKPKDRLRKFVDACKSKTKCEGGDAIDMKSRGGCGAQQPKFSINGLELLAEYKSQRKQCDEGQVPEPTERKQFLTAEKVLSVLKGISDADCQLLGLNPEYSRPDWMILQVLPIPPPAVRPPVLMSSSSMSEDDLTHQLSMIIRHNQNLRKQEQHGSAAHLISQLTQIMQYYISTYFNNSLPGLPPSLLPFMDLKKNGGASKQLLESSMRIKCFIETDAGFNPTSLKTDLGHHCPFTTAIKNLGNKPFEKENDVEVKMCRDGHLINPAQLKKYYEDRIIYMHALYDDDDDDDDGADFGEDQPVFLARPSSVPDEKGCTLSGDGWNTKHETGDEKCIAFGRIELEDHIERNCHSTIELLDEEQCQELFDGEHETGTTIGIVPFDNGLFGYTDSRRTQTTLDTDMEKVADKSSKFDVISKKQNMYFLHSGNVRKCAVLVENLRSHVKSIEEASGKVSLKGAAAFAYKYLEQYLKDNSDNELSFGGLIVSMLPSKNFDAWGVGLARKNLAQKHLKSDPHLVLGSGASFARAMLNMLCVNPDLCKREVRENLGLMYVHTFCHDYHTGGKLHMYEFQHGKDFNIDTMYESIDPLTLLKDQYQLLPKDKLIFAIKKPSPVVGTAFERHLHRTRSREVECASQLVEKLGYIYYLVTCKIPADSAFTLMVTNFRRARARDDLLPLSFYRVHYDMDGTDVLVNISPFSEEVLKHIQKPL